MNGNAANNQGVNYETVISIDKSLNLIKNWQSRLEHQRFWSLHWKGDLHDSKCHPRDWKLCTAAGREK